MKLDRSKNASPLYYQIKEYIKEKIKNEEYKVGYFIPSESELKNTFKVSRCTITKAFDDETLAYFQMYVLPELNLPKDEEKLDLNLLNLLEEINDIKAVKNRQNFEAIKCDQKLSKLFDIQQGEPLAKISTKYYDTDDKVFLFSIQFILGSKYRYLIEALR